MNVSKHIEVRNFNDLAAGDFFLLLHQDGNRPAMKVETENESFLLMFDASRNGGRCPVILTNEHDYFNVLVCFMPNATIRPTLQARFSSDVQPVGGFICTNKGDAYLRTAGNEGSAPFIDVATGRFVSPTRGSESVWTSDWEIILATEERPIVIYTARS